MHGSCYSVFVASLVAVKQRFCVKPLAAEFLRASEDAFTVLSISFDKGMSGSGPEFRDYKPACKVLMACLQYDSMELLSITKQL